MGIGDWNWGLGYGIGLDGVTVADGVALMVGEYGFDGSVFQWVMWVSFNEWKMEFNVGFLVGYSGLD